MRSIVALSILALGLAGSAVGALAQSANNTAAPKQDDAVSVWGFNPQHMNKPDAGSAKFKEVDEDAKAVKPGSGVHVDSTRPVPESVRQSAANRTVDVSARITDLQQAKTPGQADSTAYNAENTLSKINYMDRH